MKPLQRQLVLLLSLILAVVLPIRGFHYELRPNQEKCFQEELGVDVVVMGEYSAQPSYKSHLSVRVLSPTHSVIWSKDASQSTFAFTTDERGLYSTCFLDKANHGVQIDSTQSRSVSFTFKTGIDAKDYSAVAKRDDLHPLELELVKLKDVLKEINNDMKYLKTRETVMRTTNESTNIRVVWLSGISLVALVALGLFQTFYLKRFFQQKKLI